MAIRPLPAVLGAEVECDLHALRDDERQRIRQAWLDHLLLVFRDQQLTDRELLEVSAIFGETEVAAVAPRNGVYQSVAIVSNVVENGKAIGVLGAGELSWHSDHSFHEKPLGASMLHALEVPRVGGNTLFGNMYLALDTMAPDLRARVEGLTIKNDGSLNSAGERRTDAVITDLRTYEGPSHPIVRTHPETGHNALYLGRRHNAYVNGLSIEASEGLLDTLWAHATQPALTWTHEWRVGDLVVWDNGCMMHRRDSFDAAARRVMHRAQCAGDRPVYLPLSAKRGPHPRGHRPL